jgi:hypothetical protein
LRFNFSAAFPVVPDPIIELEPLGIKIIVIEPGGVSFNGLRIYNLAI